MTLPLLHENVRPNKLRPKNSDPLKIKLKKTENHNLEPFQLSTGKYKKEDFSINSKNLPDY
jgi:hypothetical protein